MLRLSVLVRNVTTALSMALTAMIGGKISIAASVVCVTGILGGTYGKPIMYCMLQIRLMVMACLHYKLFLVMHDDDTQE
jgi:putative effector of murein hydrolase